MLQKHRIERPPVSGCGRTAINERCRSPLRLRARSRKELYCNRRLSGAISRPRTATSGVRSDEGTEGIHEVNDVGARSREAERGYSASRAVARAFRRTDQSIPGLVPASLSARDADHPRSSRQHARTEPLRYREGSLAAQAVDRRQWSRSTPGRRQLQRSRLPLDGNGRGPLRTQCSDRRHPWRAASRTIRAQSKAGEPRSARAPQLRAGAASQRARSRLAAIHGARLAEPWRRRHHEPAAQVAAAAGR